MKKFGMSEGEGNREKRGTHFFGYKMSGADMSVKIAKFPSSINLCVSIFTARLFPNKSNNYY